MLVAARAQEQAHAGAFTQALATAVAHPATGSSTAIVLAGTAVSTANLTGNYLEFDTKGQPTSLAAPASDATITLTATGGPRAVVVSPITGRARVQ